jgi:predicted house-cleaning noncanonical NTP pyrophosphatase (MazG superfamily)
MLDNENAKNTPKYMCKKCDFKCSKKSDYDRHLTTTKHKMLDNVLDNAVIKNAKNTSPYICVCGKEYKHNQSYYRHKKNCSHKSNSITIPQASGENLDDKPSIMDILTQNKEIMNMLSQRDSVIDKLMLQNKEQSDTIRELIPKIGSNNNNNNGIHTTTNNQFNIQAFLNEDCKEALNFSEFIEQIKITFSDLEKQAEIGYVKGITKLFIDNLQNLGSNKRPIHCSDKKRKTLYIKENDEWDKEGSHDTLKKGIQEITNRTMRTLMKEKADRPEEYSDMDSIFSLRCLDIQRQLIPVAPRETSMGKVASNISDQTTLVDTKTLG